MSVIGYSTIKNPLWAIPFEILEGITSGLLVAAAIVYGVKISSTHNMATLQGIIATVHYGIGKLFSKYLLEKINFSYIISNCFRHFDFIL